MKKLLGIVVLGLFLIVPSQANDIRDFQIEGMSIGDSALDYFNESRIKQTMRTDYPKSKKFSKKKFRMVIFKTSRFHKALQK